MTTFLAQLLNGLTIGSFYALVALGYSMVFGVMKLINFAHGDLFTLGAYLGFSILVGSAGALTGLCGPWVGIALALVVAAIGVAAAGLVVENLAYRPVYRAGRLPLVVSALGISIVIQNAVMVIWGPRYQSFPAALVPQTAFGTGDFRITALQLFILVFSLILMAAVWFLIEKTSFGIAVRAAALDRETATLLGINYRTVVRFIFILGPGLGGIAGVMVGAHYGRISFTMGWVYALKAFTATILGGIGNIPGAMLGGLVLGVLENLFSYYVSDSWTDVFVTLVLIIVLVFRPTGLLGERRADKV
ncbi:MAG: branched-chain amino acid ABC transporter permease [Treponemataceae bacterium]